MRTLINKCLLSLILLSGAMQQVVADTQPRVLVSIKPLQLIFSEIAGDAVQVDLLLNPGVSPHIYQLKPSDMAKLSKADALVWVGPGMETFLAKVVTSLKPKRSVQLQHELSAFLSDANGHSGRDHDHDHDHGAHHHHDGHHHNHDAHGDAHLWLSPELAPEIAKVAAQLFSELRPEQAQQFQQRLAEFNKSLRTADQSNRDLLQPVGEKGFLVTHDAYGRFVGHYELNQVGALTITPERSPGARHLTQLRTVLESSQAHCVLLEPQIQPRYLNSLTEGLNIRQEILDPLGVEIEPGPGSYAQFLTNLAEAIHRCLR